MNCIENDKLTHKIKSEIKIKSKMKEFMRTQGKNKTISIAIIAVTLAKYNHLWLTVQRGILDRF